MRDSSPAHMNTTTTQPFTSSSSRRPLTHPRAEDLNTRMGACLGLRRPPYAPPPAPAHTNMQSASYGMCFSCSMPPPHHPSLPPFPPQHLKHDPKSRFRCWLATHCHSSLPF